MDKLLLAVAAFAISAASSVNAQTAYGTAAPAWDPAQAAKPGVRLGVDRNGPAAAPRAGYAFGRNLVYATGGEPGRAAAPGAYAATTRNSFAVRGRDDMVDGWRVGGGVERRLKPNLSLGMEYVYTRLKDDGFSGRALDSAPGAADYLVVNPGGDVRPGDKDLQFKVMRVTARYRF